MVAAMAAARVLGIPATKWKISVPVAPPILSAKDHSEEVTEAAAVIPDLTARMTAGDEAAYRMFYDHYYQRLLRYLLVLTGGRQEAAEEAVQLTLIRVVRYIRTFDSEPVFWSWLSLLARSSIVDEERKRKRYFALLDRFFQLWHKQTTAPDPDPDAPLLAMLNQSVGDLPAIDRTLLERKYLSGESVKEIADSTGFTESAVESRLVRIRRQLRQSLLAQLKHEKSN
jgi:RNA polymerase sigma-70 factor, ECF subfamily